jgi:hypothetical protein
MSTCMMFEQTIGSWRRARPLIPDTQYVVSFENVEHLLPIYCYHHRYISLSPTWKLCFIPIAVPVAGAFAAST